ncbi:UDP-N-acetylmuramoyl-tripeptide--D-alanyl-D-alanine ligase [Denitratisoma oestradiolicum]|uniref:UDP-N-acetylmuramoyl-tripeptide--D-alanyl-D-alanine ligase n=1 Tax=Denitratisoma oestradiolicum TaxID=311182 RepID=A0A6S6XZ59_9PROT|nr:UDP-N-acetylmuramoyl-tripeptide--D-alanyl-D-alanine ligase [Denitratisoma oestradiolicum]TWO80431.1 UDP-N-acetylmuramoyl-tripeptide--D-alanyl-D-alanine ligase [Denitratisoma oestradiolicum]CAB1370243.1 UDP-N-acetylmuramoyl-tripeptide:D-alanyl-D-alanine ligase [Denitratisoma oestradiolicum]
MMDLQQAAQACAGNTQQGEIVFSAVSTDSRSIGSGELFVALRGERFDGHDFVAEVLARGAAAALVDRVWAESRPDREALPLVVVDDTRLALGRLAAHWRAGFEIPLIGITGSNGKTTVKEMCAAILRAHYGSDESVLATAGNLNNDIGLPLTLLKLRPGHRAAVIEMGMSHRGEIAYLTRIARPTVALVNNAQRAHLEGLGSLLEVARAKGEIFEGLDADGVAVLNADDPNGELWRSLNIGREVIGFGVDGPAEVSAQVTSQGYASRMSLATPAGSAELLLPLPGLHNARNALAAVAATLAAGVPLANILGALGRYTGVKGRLQQRPGRNGALLIDDTYNANPDSMRAAVDVLAALPGRRILVIGDMGEVGHAGGQFHDELGGYAKSMGIDRLYCLGDLSAAAAANFGEGGEHFKRIESLLAALLQELGEDTTVLIKGSRFMRMERVVEALEMGEEQEHGVLGGTTDE